MKPVSPCDCEETLNSKHNVNPIDETFPKYKL